MRKHLLFIILVLFFCLRHMASYGRNPTVLNRAFTTANISATLVLPALLTTTITVGPITGTINACKGVASSAPNIQQFTFSATNLIDNITATAPGGFEISLNPATGYSIDLTIPNSQGNASGIIYVRTAATASVTNIFGDVILSSPGDFQRVAVSGTINTLATVKAVNDYVIAAGAPIPEVDFTGTGASSYLWLNDNTAIGLAASGTNFIAQTALTNNGTTPMVASIRVTPYNSVGCAGETITFKIIVLPPGVIFRFGPVTGTINACVGTPSSGLNMQQFSVNSSHLPVDAIITAPAGFEISTSGAGPFSNNVIIPQTSSTSFDVTTIYIRSAATAPAGTLDDKVTIKFGVINQAVNVKAVVSPIAIVNPVPDKNYAAGVTTTPINFTGTINSFIWKCNVVGIGLPGNSGNGNIPAFTTTNTTGAAITATFTVTPNPSVSCQGPPVVFTITIAAAIPGVISVSGNLSPLITTYGTPSSTGIFTVSGTNLTAGITISPPSGFEVSTNSTTFSKTTILGAAGTIAPTTVYIRLAANTPVGSYAGNIDLTSAGAANSLATANSNNVTQTLLTLTADNKTKITGTANPVFTYTNSGFVNNEGPSVLTIQPTINTPATLSSPPGLYPIIISGAASPNYTFRYVNGALQINPVTIDIVVNNAFTPNGDGINDTWRIENIEKFPNNVIKVFNRYGAEVFYSLNYPRPWDGKFNGGYVSTGTYYYIINLNNGNAPVTGALTVVR